MKHLSVLENAGLLTVRRSGRERWNAVNATPLRRIYERWLTPYQQLWASSLSRFGAIVKREAATVPDTVETPIRHAHIEQVTDIAATPSAVFSALVGKVQHWWLHVTYPTTPPNLRIEPHAGGRFMEISGDNERLYAVVTRYEPGKQLSLQGAMGMSGCVIGSVDVTLAEPVQAVTTLRLSHRIIGDVDDETVAMYTQGWQALLAALRAHVETGADVWDAAS